jgi:23S rRNA (cytidine1920-2'-O)/16S rRNA (cytidine1409-2'-O)-methyltransferase
MRIDVFLCENKYYESRTKALNAVSEGKVAVNGVIITKPSYSVSRKDNIETLTDDNNYVSRGALKLETAAQVFGIGFRGLTCVDAGASTGGFTDFMLQNGAEKVFAVDTGTNQLHEKLRNNPRVVSFEKTDIRNFIPETPADFITADVAFISLKLIIPAVHRILKQGGRGVLLIKPQFETGRKFRKNGIVKSEKEILSAVKDVSDFIVSSGLKLNGTVKSKIKGGDGNTEYLAFLEK